MANRAKQYDDELANKTGRSKKPITPRAKPYFTSVMDGVSLGYVCRRPKCGHWIVRLTGKRKETSGRHSYSTYEQSRLGYADDLKPANGRDILDFRQARERAAAYVPDASITVNDAIKRYLSSMESEKGSAAKTDAEQRLNLHVVPIFGNRKLTSIKAVEFSEWRERLTRPQDADGRSKARKRDLPFKRKDGRVSKATANRIMANFKAALNQAYKDFELESQNVKPIWRGQLEVFEIKKGETARKDHFTAEQVLTLIDKARESDAHFADLIEAGFYTGARYGELTALDVRHFNAAKKQLDIPGGKTGERTTTLTAEAAAFFERVAKGKAADDILLPRADGGRWSKNHQQKPFKAALKAAKLSKSATYYALRHTYISRAIEAGMPLLLIAKNVGTSVKMIEAHYGKFIEDTQAQLIETMAPRLRPVLTVVQGGQQAA